MSVSVCVLLYYSRYYFVCDRNHFIPISLHISTINIYIYIYIYCYCYFGRVLSSHLGT